MTPQAAARIQKHGRRLLTARVLSTSDFAVLDCLLWRVRAPGRSSASVTYSAIARLCGIARGTAIEAIRRLVGLHLIDKTKRRVKVMWGRGQIASRQIANAYEILLPPTESADRPTDRSESILSTSNSRQAVDNSPLQKALEGFAVAMGRELPA